MPNWASIGSSLAAKCAGIDGIAQVAYPPPTEFALTPAIAIFSPSVTHTEYPSLDEYRSRWAMRLYVERTADYAEPANLLDPYISAVYSAFASGRTLALNSDGVMDCRIARHEIDHLNDYGGAYVGARFEIEVRVLEPVTRTA